MSNLADIKDKTPNQDLISILEQALEDAKSGELRTAITVFGWNDDAWTTRLGSRSKKHKKTNARRTINGAIRHVN